MWKKKHVDVNEEHDRSIREMKTNEERDQIGHLSV